MFGGQVKVPLVVRMPQGAGHQLGPTHSHSWEAMFLHVPGLPVATPSTAADAKGLLKSAIRDENPVVFIEHEYLYGQRGEVPDDADLLVPFGVAAVRREGADVTLVGISRMAVTAERAAVLLAEHHGISAEVIDPRTLRPLDLETILASVRKTNRVVVVEEGWPHGGVGANLSALIAEHAFDYLERRPCGSPGPTCRCRTRRPSSRSPSRTRRRSSMQSSGCSPVAEIEMPRLSDSMEEGTILKWLKAAGEDVGRGEALVEIETDKATMTYESSAAGRLEIVAAEGDTLPIGAVIARMGVAGRTGGWPGPGRGRPGRRRRAVRAIVVPESPSPAAGGPGRTPGSGRAGPGRRERGRARG